MPEVCLVYINKIQELNGFHMYGPVLIATSRRSTCQRSGKGNRLTNKNFIGLSLHTYVVVVPLNHPNKKISTT